MVRRSGSFGVFSRLRLEKGQLARDVDAMRAEACGWMVDYLGRMRGELAGVAKSAKTREIQRHLQFYLTNKIREGIDACVKAHGRSIADLTATYSRDLVGEAMDLSLRGVELAIGSNLANVDWTGAVTVSYVGRLANEVLGGALTSLVMVGDVIAGVFRERQLSKRQADIIQPLLAEFSDVEESVLKVLETTYREMKNLACERLDDSYHAQLTQSAEALGNARAALEGEDVRAADLRERLDEVLEQVREYTARVAEML